MTVSLFTVIAIFVLTIAALVTTNRRPSFIFSCSTLALIVTQSLTIEQVSSHLGNQGLITLLLLLMVSMGVEKTGLIKRLAHRLVDRNFTASFTRLFGLTFIASAFLNNTAVVATLLGPVKQSQHIAPSRLLIPLSYAAILGGTLTLVGTSTNLIVNSFLLDHGHSGFAFWDFTVFGLVAGGCCALLMFLFRHQLPDLASGDVNQQDYFVEASVLGDSKLVGKSVEQNSLRNLPELFLAEIVRDGHLITPVSPDEIIHANDKLIFTGNVKRVDSLQHLDGIRLFADENGLLRDNLTEVILSNRSRLIGKTLKQAGFRALFDAAVVAIRRDGHVLSGKLGDITLEAGDFLVLATGPDFAARHNLAKNFFIVSEHGYEKKLNNRQEWLTLGGFVTTILLSASGIVPLSMGLMLLLVSLIVLNILSGDELKRNLPLNLILIIVGALSLASALEQAGAISLLTSQLAPVLTESSIFVALIGIYVTTLVLTELVTNNAAAALIFPFAWGICEALNAPVLPFALAVAFAASASFLSPYGYQTNLLVFSAGNYKVKHFIRYGLPISVTYSCIILWLLKWQFNL